MAAAKRVILHAVKMDAHASGVREVNIAATNARVGTVAGPTHQDIGHATHANEASEQHGEVAKVHQGWGTQKTATESQKLRKRQRSLRWGRPRAEVALKGAKERNHRGVPQSMGNPCGSMPGQSCAASNGNGTPCPLEVGRQVCEEDLHLSRGRHGQKGETKREGRAHQPADVVSIEPASGETPGGGESGVSRPEKAGPSRRGCGHWGVEAEWQQWAQLAPVT